MSSDAQILSLWVEVLTGTERRGGGIQPLSLDAWNERKSQLESHRDIAPPEEWFKPSKPTQSKPLAPAK